MEGAATPSQGSGSSSGSGSTAGDSGEPGLTASPGSGKLLHVPSMGAHSATEGGAAKIGSTKRRGTTEVIFEGSDMQAAVAALAFGDSSDEDAESPEASPRAKGRPRSRSAGFANEAVVDLRVTPSLQRTLDTLERVGLGRHKMMFLRERITFDTLEVLVEDDAKLAELGLAMGERVRLHKELRPVIPEAVLRRPVRRNSFDKWYGEDAQDPGAGVRVEHDRTSAFINAEYKGFQGSTIIENIEDIQLGSFIAEGTSGGVYNATWRGMRCAVKRFRFSKDDAGLAETFVNEVFLLQNLSHDNLVRFYGACTTPPNLCILTELMTGSLLSLLYGSLARRPDGTLRELNDKRQAHILMGIATGMAFLHSHSVAHRDLKSANVLYDKQLNIKLCDFAFSKFKRKLSGLMDSQVGTPAWMAPEVLRGDEYTLKCDVYSAGVIMWELVHREEPLKGVNQYAVAIKVGMEGHRLPIDPSCSLIWRRLMEACWAEPDDRPSFAEIEKILAEAKQSIKSGASLARLTATGTINGAAPTATTTANQRPASTSKLVSAVVVAAPTSPPEVAAGMAALTEQTSTGANVTDHCGSAHTDDAPLDGLDSGTSAMAGHQIPEGTPIRMSRPGQGPATSGRSDRSMSPRAPLEGQRQSEPEPEPEPEPEHGRGTGAESPRRSSPERRERRASLIWAWSRRLSDEVSAAASIALEATISVPEKRAHFSSVRIGRRNSYVYRFPCRI
jgi:serine/threonine protein kinase